MSLDNVLKEFGMVRNVKEEMLAKKLYNIINKGKELSTTEVKDTIFGILHINSKKDVMFKYNDFEIFHLNKMMENNNEKSVKPTIEELLIAVRKVQEAETKCNKRVIEETIHNNLFCTSSKRLNKRSITHK